MSEKDQDLRPSIYAQGEEKISDESLRETQTIRTSVQTANANWDEDASIDAITDSTPEKPVVFPWYAKIVFIIIVLASVELFHYTIQIWRDGDWLGGLWLILFLTVFSIISLSVLREWRGLKKLHRQRRYQQKSLDMYNSPTIGAAQAHCEGIANQLPDVFSQAISQWKTSSANAINDKEQLVLFEHLVLCHADKQAFTCISRHAAASGAMIAVSPFALLDMGIVVWRNIRMINEITACYGIRLGYWSRIALIKKLFGDMLIAGAAEILSDGANYALGTGVTGKVSTSAAQGISAGLFTIRLGLKALEQSRPMPFLDAKRPSIRRIASQLIMQLTKPETQGS